MRLTYKQLLMTGAPVIVVGCAVIVVATRSSERSLLRTMELAQVSEARLRADGIDQFFGRGVRTLEALATAEILRRGGVADIVPFLKAQQALLPEGFEGLYYNEPGGVVHGTDGTTFAVRDRDYYPQLTRGEIVVTRLPESRASGHDVVLIVVPIVTANGTRVGALGGTIRIDQVLTGIEQTGPHFDGFAALVDERRQVIACAGDADSAALAELAPASAAVTRWDDAGGFMMCAVPTQFAGWSMVLARRRVDALASVASMRRTASILCAITVLAALLLVWGAMHATVQPLRRLLAVLRSYAAGEEVSLPVTSQDEIGEVAREFSALTGRLRVALNERAQAMRAMQQAQRLESIGQLAGGVAHDFNNLLTAIGGGADLAMAAFESGDATLARAELDGVHAMVARGGKLTAQLLGFARKQFIVPRPVEIGVIIEDYVVVLRRLIPSNIRLELRLPADVHTVHVDPVQVEQVLMNLVINARDAMPGGGSVYIETENIAVEPGSGYILLDPTLAPGHYVVLSVTDTGMGIAPDVMSRIFEPFFTTKEASCSSGLGLATCYGILRQNGGAILAYSEPGHGATFRAFFPAVGVAPLRDGSREQDDTGVRPVRGTLLLVEDHEAVRASIAAALAHAGHTVFQARDGREALGLIAELQADLNLVLTDVVMPDLSGQELAMELAKSHPHIPVLFMSGYPALSSEAQGWLSPGVDLLRKPFTTRVLLQRVARALTRVTA